MPNQIIKNSKVVKRDDGWKIPDSVPPAYIWRVHIMEDGDRQMYSTMDPELVEDYEGDIEVYTAKSSGKTYVRGVKAAREAQEKIAHQEKNSKDITLGMVWKTVAGIRGLPEDDDDFAKFFDIVRAHFEELVLMSEKMKEEPKEENVTAD